MVFRVKCSCGHPKANRWLTAEINLHWVSATYTKFQTFFKRSVLESENFASESNSGTRNILSITSEEKVVKY